MNTDQSTGEEVCLIKDLKEEPAAPCTIAKAYGEPYVNWATKVMLGAKLKDFQFKPRLDGYAIKVPVFSFDKFPNVDKSLGPEMKSTGEAIYFIKDLKDPFFRQVYGERSMYLSR